MTDDEIVRAMAEELLAKDHVMELALRPASVFQLVAAIQLALRHPNVPTEIRTVAEAFVAAASAFFLDCPTVLDVIERGNNPACDIEVPH